ncbi:G-type lectin S-receptor-like serine/threonine-protein kinase RLK1 [Chenopodium quinoa]|uniref:G-type lectin S-receptor-like serine/threonine-protein kinase RLK1 n=1 Tax=Chenopodium quinoa TaxID=63459 RepID=UPI000B77775B|nr:G-type lectin S-receptor-like serine/threonine-protein kinase RLK1 [Chenopodium quinoa]
MAWPPSNTLYLLTLIILLQTPLISAKNTSSIPVCRSLTATVNDSSWLSPLNSFAFGFTKYSNSSKLFLLAIWYAKIIPITIVWHANDGIPVPQGSSVRITATAGLVLSNPEGISLWNTSDELSDGNEVSYGFLYDTGNFVLKRSSSDDDVVWQSFDHPTDTLLPTQSMEIDGVVYLKLSETNFTKGRFQLNFELRDDIRGNLILNSRDLTTGFGYGAYYNSGI